MTPLPQDTEHWKRKRNSNGGLRGLDGTHFGPVALLPRELAVVDLALFAALRLLAAAQLVGHDRVLLDLAAPHATHALSTAAISRALGNEKVLNNHRSKLLVGQESDWDFGTYIAPVAGLPLVLRLALFGLAPLGLGRHGRGVAMSVVGDGPCKVDS